MPIQFLPQDSDSAVSRCPFDVWWMILRQVGHAVPWDVYDDMFEMPNYDWRLSKSPYNLSIEQRAAAHTNLNNCSLVCREFHYIAFRLMPEWVTVFPGSRQIKSFAENVGRRMGYLTLGRFVRRLVLIGESVRERVIVEILNECLQLEEFILECDVQQTVPSSFRLIVALISACPATLTSYIAPTCPIRFCELLLLLTGCRKLKRLAIAGWPLPPFGPYPQLLFPSLSLTTLELHNPHVHSVFVSQVAALDLPNLHTIHFTTDMDDRWEEMSVPPELVSMFRKHGHKIRSLFVDGLSISHPRLGANLLDYCPNLEEIILHLRPEHNGAALSEHPSLRRVGFRYFFADADLFPAHSLELTVYAHNALSTIKSFLGPQCPKLEYIRCLDVEPASAETRALAAVHGDIPQEYRVLAGLAASACGARNVRFEDVTGKPVGLDFAPTDYYILTE